MRFKEKTELLERMDQLIRLRATGSSRDLAKRLGVSKSTVYQLLDVMKHMGADIEYCTSNKSFYYVTNKILAIGFVEPDELKTKKE